MEEQSAVRKTRSGSVQSIERAFSILELMADQGGAATVSQLAASSGFRCPRSTGSCAPWWTSATWPRSRRASTSWRPKLVRLGESASGMLHVWARPELVKLVDELGESANLAMLDGDQIVYVVQEQSRHSMRMFTEVGRRVLPHCTAVGKALMAPCRPTEVRAILQRTGMPRYTPNTITDPEDFAEALRKIAAQGYAIDEGEQEVGVRCVAVALPDAPSRLALSVSGPATRMTEEVVGRAVPLLTEAGRALAARDALTG